MRNYLDNIVLKTLLEGEEKASGETGIPQERLQYLMGYTADRFKTLYAQGMTNVYALSQTLHLSPSTLELLAKGHDIVLDGSQPTGVSRPTGIRQERRLQYEHLIKEGKSAKEIALALGVKPGTVYAYLRYHNLSRSNRLAQYTRLVEGGKSVEEIAHVLGVTRTAVYSYLRHHNLPYHLSNAGRSTEYSRLVEEGKSIDQIAYAFGVKPSIVYSYIRSHKLLNSYRKHHPKWSAYHRREYPGIEDMALAGTALEALGQQYGVSRERARQILHSQGIHDKWKYAREEARRKEREQEEIHRKTELTRLAGQGRTIDQMVQETGLAESTVRQLLCHYNLMPRESRTKLGVQAAILAFVEQGKTIPEIAQARGVKQQSAYCYLTQHPDIFARYKQLHPEYRTYQRKKIGAYPGLEDAAAKGEPMETLASMFGVCAATMRAMLRRHNLYACWESAWQKSRQEAGQMRRENRQKQQKELLEGVIQQGKTIEEIAAQLHCKPRTIHRQFYRYGLARAYRERIRAE